MGKRTGVYKICEVCGEEFYLKPSVSGSRYCSLACVGISRRTDHTPNIHRICEICGEEFYVIKARSEQKYCSTACYGISKQRGLHKICEICGEEFYVSPSVSYRKYCSNACADRGSRTGTYKICEICGEEFYVNKARSDKKYCSSKCNGVADMKRVSLVCSICGSDFEVIPARIRRTGIDRITCSRECADKQQNQGLTPESRRVRQSKAYQEWRHDVFERDGFTCQMCGKSSTILHAHHKKSYARYPDLQLDVDNGVTFCYDCHVEEHKRLREKENNDA